MTKTKKDQKPAKPYKEQEFEMYVLWKSLPVILRGQEEGVYQQLKITDEIILSLLEIKNQGQFAKRFGIKELGTLTDWNKKIEDEDLIKEKRKSWARRLTSNVVLALYKQALREGDAARTKLWLEYFEDHVGEVKVNIPELKETAKSIKEIIEKLKE